MSHNRDLSAAAAQLGFHSSNIGIGTENPGTKLDVRGGNWSNGDIVVGQSGNAGRVKFRRGADGSDSAFIGFAAADNNSRLSIGVDSGDGTIAFQTNSAERLRIDSNGNLGVNKTPETDWNGSYRAIEVGNSSVSGYQGNTYPSIEMNMNCRGTAASYSSGWKYIRSMRATQIHMPYSGEIKFRRANSGSADGAITWSESMRITSTGDVGIGNDASFPIYTDATDRTLIIGTGSNDSAIQIHSGTTKYGGVYFGDATSGAARYYGYVEYKHDDDFLRFATAGSERLRITSDGKFGFNTTNPGAFDSGANHFVLLGNTSGTGNAGITISSGTDSYGNIYFADGTNGADAYRGHIAYNHNGNTMRFATDGSERLRIGSGGNLALGGQNTSAYSGHTNLFLGGIANLYAETTAASTGSLSVSNNAYINSSGNWVYRVNGKASNAYQYDGGYGFRTAGTGSAGGTISWTERFSIDSSGRVKKPYQPAFKAKLNSATGANFSGTLVFNNVSYNVGSHYNSSNGRFTAPVDGKYLFCWYDNIEISGNGAIYVDWLINGNAQGNRIYSYESGGWQGIAGSIIFDLNTNDYVQIYGYSSGNYDGGSYGAFSGCLLG